MNTITDQTTPLMNPALYVVATPIGNLQDMTLRALAVLRSADCIAAEDTRHTGKLLQHYGIQTRLFALHEHNEAQAAQKLIDLLQQGQSIALVSDAGTPGISDPGARAVSRVRAAGFPVVPVPGPSAFVAALSAAGLTETPFLFHGFLPPKSGARRSVLSALAAVPVALVFYEAPHRVVETIADMAATLGGERGAEGGREIIIARELTKLFESIVRLPLEQAGAWIEEDAHRQRGEFVLIVTAPPPLVGLAPQTEQMLKTLLAELPLKQAVKLAAQLSDAPRNELYKRALVLSGES